MSLPFSRFSAIKGCGLLVPYGGLLSGGVGAIAMRCSPRMDVKPHCCSFFCFDFLGGVTGKTSYLLLMVQNSQGQPLVMLIKPLRKNREKLATSTGDFTGFRTNHQQKYFVSASLGGVIFIDKCFWLFCFATDLRLRLTCKVRVVQHELIESLTTNPSKLLDPNSWRKYPPNLEPKFWGSQMVSRFWAPRWMSNHIDSQSV